MNVRILSLLAVLSALPLSATASEPNSCVGNYVTPNVIDAMRSHYGVIEVPLNKKGSVTIVLGADVIIEEYESGLSLNWDVSSDKSSVVVRNNSSDLGTAEFNIETARGRMHTIRLIFGEHEKTTHKVVIEN